MSIDLTAIRKGAVANIQTIDRRLRLVPFYSDTLNISTDGVIEIGPTPGENQTITDRAGGVLFWYYLTATIYIMAVDEETAQIRMDQYLSIGGPRSVWTALLSDRTLGGTVGLTEIDRQRGYGLVQRHQERLLMSGWDFRVKVAP